MCVCVYVRMCVCMCVCVSVCVFPANTQARRCVKLTHSCVHPCCAGLDEQGINVLLLYAAVLPFVFLMPAAALLIDEKVTCTHPIRTHNAQRTSHRFCLYGTRQIVPACVWVCARVHACVCMHESVRVRRACTAASSWALSSCAWGLVCTRVFLSRPSTRP